MNDKRNNFLEYWKKGVHLAGDQFFDIKSGDIDSANDKEQLVPSFNFIKDIFGSLSHGEKIMVGLLYSFYDPEEGQVLLTEANAANFVDAISFLDDQRKEVILGLLANHSGW